MVRSATCNAASKALDVAALIACTAAAGSAEPMSSIGLPAMLPSRAARLGCSSAATALRSAVRSRSLMGRDSIKGCAPCRITGVLAACFPACRWRKIGGVRARPWRRLGEPTAP